MPELCRYLWGLRDALFDAMEGKGRTFRYKKIKVRWEEDFLYMRLASGRPLAYYKPKIVMRKPPWDSGPIPTITHMGIDSYNKKWGRIVMTPGRATENVVQASARDIMVDRAFAVEDAGYPIIGSVHDELISEADEDHGSLEEYERIMGDQPSWIQGIPIPAEGWVGRRYRKE